MRKKRLLSILVLVSLVLLPLLSIIPIPASYVSANPSMSVRTPTSASAGFTANIDKVINKPTGTAQGDFLITAITIHVRGNTPSLTGVPTGWTEITSGTYNDIKTWLYYKVAGGSEPASYTWSFTQTSGGATNYLIMVTECVISGCFDSADPIDTYSTVDYLTSNTIVRASMTTAQDNEAMVFFACIGNTDCTFTKPSVPGAWTEDYDGNYATYVSMEACHYEWSSHGATGNIDATMSTSNIQKHGFAVALNLPVAPTVANLPATGITNATAILNGNLTSNGGASTTVHIYWGDSDGITNSTNWAHDINLGVLPTGTFDSNISSLVANTTYYYRCYAVNSIGSDWSDVTDNFTTFLTYTAPTVVTYGATDAYYFIATLNGGITDTGNDNPATRGFQWGTSTGNYTSSWNETGDFGVGNFSYNAIGLSANTTYYFRAFAINDNGTGNGGELSLTTLVAVPLGYSFHQIDPPVQITIPANDTWVTINASTYGVPIGATGILFQVGNWEGMGGEDCPFGIRKNGSSDNRIDPIWEHTPVWGAVGVDANCLFQVYKSSITSSFGIWIMGYTTAGVTFLTNGVDKTPISGGWQDIDCSVEAPGAIGLIFEVVGPSRDEAMTNYGFRNNGSTDTFVYNAPDHQAWVMIGCDSNQITEGYATSSFDFYLIGYVTDGAYFYINGVYQGPDVAEVWTDLPTVLPAGSVMGFYEYRGSGSAYSHGLRKNNTSGILYTLDNRHCWAWSNCDDNGIVEGRVMHVSVDYYLVGYATQCSQYIWTDYAEPSYTSTDLYGTIVDKNGETIEFRGFEYGLTQNATWSTYETGLTYTTYGHSSDNYLDNVYTKRGQHVTLDINLLKLSFRLEKVGSPTGSVTYTVRNASSDAVLWSEVLGDASTIAGGGAWLWYEIELDGPFTINGDVRMSVEFTNGNATDKVNTGYWTPNAGSGEYTSYTTGSWSDTSSREMEFTYTYEAPGDFGTGSYNLAIDDLIDETGYWFRSYMDGNVTSYYGSWAYFETLEYMAPTVTNSAATDILYSGAELHGTITNNGGKVVETVGFEWDIDSGIPYTNSWNTSYSSDDFEHIFDDMPNDSTIYWRAFAINEIGTGNSSERSFATYATPSVTTEPATYKAITSAILVGTVNGLGGLDEVYVHFEWGLNITYSNNTTEDTRTSVGDFSAALTELSANTTYYFRAALEYDEIMTYGAPRTFTTPCIIVGMEDPDLMQIESVEVYDDYLGGQLYVISYKLVYEETPIQIASDYYRFEIREDEVLRATGTVTGWTYRPASIYLKGDGELTWGEDYTVWLTGLSSQWSIPPSTSYELSLSNWKGDNLDLLDEWVRNLALRMEDYYELEFTTWLGVRGLVLNDQGAQIFRSAIPSLEVERPNLFGIGGSVDIDTTPQSDDYAQNLTAAQNFGAEALEAFTNLGAHLGLSGTAAAGVFWFIILLLAVGGATAKSGSTTVGAVAGVPLLAAGAYLGLVPLWLIGIFGAILIVYAFANLWLART